MKKYLATILLSLFASVSIAHAKQVILDVRTPEEFSTDHVAQAVNIDFKNKDFKDKVAKLDRNDEYELYCRTGNRSGKALTMMKEMGFKNLKNLGGLDEAKKALAR
jgi:phage shock protein E